MKISDVIYKLNNLYPQENAESWDFVGLQYGNTDTLVKKIIVSLDLTSEVLEKCINENINFVIVHHPFLFNEDLNQELEDFPYKKNMIEKIKNNNIGIFVIHTNFDASSNGMKNAVVDKLNLPLIKELKYGVILKINHNFYEIWDLLSNFFDLKKYFTNIKHNLPFKKMAFLPGAGGPNGILEAKNNNCDLIVTSDVKWSTWILAKEIGIGLIQISHQVEKIMVSKVASQLKDIQTIEYVEEIF